MCSDYTEGAEELQNLSGQIRAYCTFYVVVEIERLILAKPFRPDKGLLPSSSMVIGARLRWTAAAMASLPLPLDGGGLGWGCSAGWTAPSAPHLNLLPPGERKVSAMLAIEIGDLLHDIHLLSFGQFGKHGQSQRFRGSLLRVGEVALAVSERCKAGLQM